MYKVSLNSNSYHIVDIDDLIDSDFEERMLLKLSFGGKKDKISEVIRTVMSPDDNHLRHWENIYGFTEKEFDKKKDIMNYKKELYKEIRNFLREECPQLDFNDIKDILKTMSYLRLFSVSIQIKELFLVFDK
jgi:hypothetical protein